VQAVLSISCDAVDVRSSSTDRAFYKHGSIACVSLPSRERANRQGLQNGLLCEQVLLR
jgi:hypothetical protein